MFVRVYRADAALFNFNYLFFITVNNQFVAL